MKRGEPVQRLPPPKALTFKAKQPKTKPTTVSGAGAIPELGKLMP